MKCVISAFLRWKQQYFISQLFFWGSVCFSSVSMGADIQWKDNQFEHSTQISAGKIVEICESVDAKTKIEWSFTASEPVGEFNIHRHEGKEVFYAIRKDGVKSSSGVHESKQPYEWCWMWTNHTKSSISLKFSAIKR